MSEIDFITFHKDELQEASLAKIGRFDIHLLKQIVERGNYRIPADDIADRMLAAQLFLFTHRG